MGNSDQISLAEHFFSFFTASEDYYNTYQTTIYFDVRYNNQSCFRLYTNYDSFIEEDDIVRVDFILSMPDRFEGPSGVNVTIVDDDCELL